MPIRRSTPRPRADATEQSPNLVPVMSILVILVPMLLFAFTFFEVRIQAVTAPRQHPPSARPGERGLDLTVLATRRGFVVKGNPDLLPEGAVVPRAEAALEAGADYDYATLYTRLVAIKDRFPAEQRLHVGAEPDVPWHVVARTLDAARVRLARPAYDSSATYAVAAPLTDGRGDEIALFEQIDLVVAE